ncbi:hypothetical protein O7626_08960 [Micromonospora sp. WMMD1102]|uniref:hypothetical protein n=1 Tax=Micromonospora sp. WMMD1102 TaxID=3016105 RepID=UPI002414FB17|nr:hypothetical protein [Micromonospora sp. WMMD1102]MDG4786053.1 hypothetical protein [Micromonospora sp. WMMD1102]
MSDPYRAPTAPRPGTPAHQVAGRGVLRPLLWVLLIASAAANGISSMTDLSPLVGIGFGLGTLGCAGALILHHYRHRRPADPTG